MAGVWLVICDSVRLFVDLWFGLVFVGWWVVWVSLVWLLVRFVFGVGWLYSCCFLGCYFFCGVLVVVIWFCWWFLLGFIGFVCVYS